MKKSPDFTLILERTNIMAYGIACHFQDDGRFSFIVGEQVETSNDEMDPGFVRFELPEGLYAEFKVNGSSDLAP